MLQIKQFPISWTDVERAKSFLRGLVVQTLDHNTAHLGITCLRLAWLHARSALCLDEASDKEQDFRWLLECTIWDALRRMWEIPHYKRIMKGSQLT